MSNWNAWSDIVGGTGSPATDPRDADVVEHVGVVNANRYSGTRRPLQVTAKAGRFPLIPAAYVFADPGKAPVECKVSTSYVEPRFALEAPGRTLFSFPTDAEDLLVQIKMRKTDFCLATAAKRNAG